MVKKLIEQRTIERRKSLTRAAEKYAGEWYAIVKLPDELARRTVAEQLETQVASLRLLRARLDGDPQAETHKLLAQSQNALVRLLLLAGLGEPVTELPEL